VAPGDRILQKGNHAYFERGGRTGAPAF
jgi:hypothetical protein